MYILWHPLFKYVNKIVTKTSCLWTFNTYYCKRWQSLLLIVYIRSGWYLLMALCGVQDICTYDGDLQEFTVRSNFKYKIIFWAPKRGLHFEMIAKRMDWLKYKSSKESLVSIQLALHIKGFKNHLQVSPATRNSLLEVCDSSDQDRLQLGCLGSWLLGKCQIIWYLDSGLIMI